METVPSVVMEVGWSESYPELPGDIDFWMVELAPEISCGILVNFNRKVAGVAPFVEVFRPAPAAGGYGSGPRLVRFPWLLTGVAANTKHCGVLKSEYIFLLCFLYNIEIVFVFLFVLAGDRRWCGRQWRREVVCWAVGARRRRACNGVVYLEFSLLYVATSSRTTPISENRLRDLCEWVFINEASFRVSG